MKQVTLEELERITGLPRYAVVEALGLVARKLQREVLSQISEYVKPLDKAVEEVAKNKVLIRMKG
ncbi:hypothetical protein HPY42_05835 [Coprothermobacteraceae bacterium]|nr:hypothetical protein [Coprothermobacteraceae bacterium]